MVDITQISIRAQLCDLLFEALVRLAGARLHFTHQANKKIKELKTAMQNTAPNEAAAKEVAANQVPNSNHRSSVEPLKFSNVNESKILIEIILKYN